MMHGQTQIKFNSLYVSIAVRTSKFNSLYVSIAVRTSKQWMSYWEKIF